MQTTIKTLLKKGYSQTYIAKTLHVSRKTIRKIIRSEEGGENTLSTSGKKVYMVLTALPGEEAQVDYGYIGTIKVKGKPRKAWVFIMSLSYSRYMYAS